MARLPRRHGVMTEAMNTPRKRTRSARRVRMRGRSDGSSTGVNNIPWSALQPDPPVPNSQRCVLFLADRTNEKQRLRRVVLLRLLETTLRDVNEAIREADQMLWQLRIEYTLRTNQNNEAPKKQWKIPAIQALLAPPFESFQSRMTKNVESPQPPSRHRARRFRTRFRSGRSTPQAPSRHGKPIDKVKRPQEDTPSIYQPAGAYHSQKEHVTIHPKRRPHSESIMAEYGSSSETVTDSMVISMMSTELSTPLFGSAQAYRRGILRPSHPSQHPHFHRHCPGHRRYNSTDTRVHWANNNNDDDRPPQTPFPSAAVVALLKSLSQLSPRTRDALLELAAALDAYALQLDRVDTLQAQFLRHHRHLPAVTRQRIDAILAASDAILASGHEAIERAVGGSLVLSSIRAETVVLEVRRRKKSEGLHDLWAAGQQKKPKKEKRWGVTSVGEVARVGSDERDIEECRGRRDEHMQLVTGTYEVRAYDRIGMQGEGALL